VGLFFVGELKLFYATIHGIYKNILFSQREIPKKIIFNIIICINSANNNVNPTIPPNKKFKGQLQELIFFIFYIFLLFISITNKYHRHPLLRPLHAHYSLAGLAGFAHFQYVDL
jgi:fatty-acid desaturase